jgi:4'-phosphopantetheinyl transferase
MSDDPATSGDGAFWERRDLRTIPTLEPGGVHVWAIDLDAWHGDSRGILLESEQRRIAAHKHPSDRESLSKATMLKRLILGRYLGVSPGDVSFRYGPQGKPYLSDSTLSFSSARSGPLIVLALSRCGELGVDIEKVVAFPNLSDVAKSSLPWAAQKILALEGRAQLHAFYREWTRWEALIKARGTGLGDTDPRPNPWHITSFQVDPEFLGAVALGSKKSDTRWFRTSDRG